MQKPHWVLDPGVGDTKTAPRLGSNKGAISLGSFIIPSITPSPVVIPHSPDALSPNHSKALPHLPEGHWDCSRECHNTCWNQHSWWWQLEWAQRDHRANHGPSPGTQGWGKGCLNFDEEPSEGRSTEATPPVLPSPAPPQDHPGSVPAHSRAGDLWSFHWHSAQWQLLALQSERVCPAQLHSGVALTPCQKEQNSHRMLTMTTTISESLQFTKNVHVNYLIQSSQKPCKVGIDISILQVRGTKEQI